ncbi:MAG TPA: hypothetical protein VL983_09215 [Terriglobales bacterium]|nr:hypothetical protein [Terriglobales bacterium]
MTKILLIAGGILNTLFCIFHVFLGYQIHSLMHLAPPVRALLEALNAGGALFILFFAYASLLRGAELMETGLGRAVLALVSVLYLSRAAEEFFLFQFTPIIFAGCLLVGAIYVTLFAIAPRKSPAPPLEVVEIESVWREHLTTA